MRMRIRIRKQEKCEKILKNTNQHFLFMCVCVSMCLCLSMIAKCVGTKRGYSILWSCSYRQFCATQCRFMGMNLACLENQEVFLTNNPYISSAATNPFHFSPMYVSYIYLKPLPTSKRFARILINNAYLTVRTQRKAFPSSLFTAETVSMIYKWKSMQL